MRILLVEDSIEVSTEMVELLASRDHTAEVVTSVDDAKALLALDYFDLIVLDLNLPGGSGHLLIEHCHAARLPIFIVSARTDLEDRVALLESGADDYLVKPFDPLNFGAVGALRRPKARPKHVNGRSLDL